LGVYLGALSPEEVVQRVKGADVLLSLGVMQMDLTLGAFTANIDHHRLILATDTEVTVGYCTFKDVPLWSFLPALVEASKTESITIAHDPIPAHEEFLPTDSPNSVKRTVAALESHLDSRHGLLLDPGEALFPSVDMGVPAYAHASAYYATKRYAVPAAIGVGVADPDRRPVVVVKDGAFSMTGLGAAACAFHHVNAIFVVLDNNGYGTQRPIIDGPLNDIPALAVENLPSVMGTGLGWKVTTESELDQALSTAVASDQVWGDSCDGSQRCTQSSTEWLGRGIGSQGVKSGFALSYVHVFLVSHAHCYGFGWSLGAHRGCARCCRAGEPDRVLYFSGPRARIFR
jgi:TPP-dependent 2-oxoacid decarboxylase